MRVVADKLQESATIAAVTEAAHFTLHFTLPCFLVFLACVVRQEEIDAMRTLLNCNVCHERQKNVIITKCCHVFCSKCIQKNLETRNRKCPGCGVPFGQADVKQFYYT